MKNDDSNKSVKTLSKSEKEYFLSLKTDDINLKLLDSLFSDTYDVKNNKRLASPYNTYDEIVLEANEYINKEKVLTNCGLFIINKYLIEEDFKEIVGYMNTPLNNKGYKKLDSTLSNALKDDKITPEQYIKFLNRVCWIAFTYNSQICSSLSIKSSMPLPTVQKRKQELLKKHAKEIQESDIPTIVKIEDELLELAKKELVNDPAMELYDSGARGSFNNAYKTAQVWKGAIFNESENRFEIMTNSWYEGIGKEQMGLAAGSVVNSVYPKALGTSECGHLSKIINSAFQAMELQEKGTDCGTTETNTVIITPESTKYYMYSYMINSSGKLIRIDENNINSLLGKKIKVRSAQYCKDYNKCNVCAGDILFSIGVKQMGMSFGKMSSSLLRAKLKAVHDATIKAYEIDDASVFVPIK